MSGAMANRLKMSLVVVSLLLASAGNGSAIQLVGDKAGSNAGLGAAAAAPKPELSIAEKGGTSLPKAGTEIWIPGLGVVGKMPSLDFGLDLLYGQDGAAADSVPDRSDFSDVDPNFAIKGTIRKKF